MIGFLLVVAAFVLAILVGFGVHFASFTSLNLLALAVAIGFLGVLVGVVVPRRGA